MGQVDRSHVENPTPADTPVDTAPTDANVTGYTPTEPPRRGLRRLRLSAEERRAAMDSLML